MSTDDSVSFDLVDQPWICVRTLAGDTVELSLLEVFAHAHELTALAGELPTQDFALLRLLLAILHRALDGPVDLEAWEDLWHAETLPVDAVAAYLARLRPRFDLFHPATPFFQVAGLRTAKGETSELSKLIADVPNGRPFFTTRLGPELSLSFAEAARWLVHCHAFDPSGIKSGAVGDERVRSGRGYPIGTGWSGRLGGVVPEAATLRETVLLNLIPWRCDAAARPYQADLPVWERDPHGPAVRDVGEPTGPVDLYTWQSRRVRLVPEGNQVTSVLICNGDPCPPQNRHRVETHSLWRRSQAQEKQRRERVVYMPLEHSPERTIWRGLHSLLPGAARGGQGTEAADRLTAGVLEWLAELTEEGVLDRDFPVTVRTVGMLYGSNNSVTDDIVDDAMSLRSELLRRDATHLVGVALACAQAADDSARALGTFALQLAQAAGKAPPAKPGRPDPADVADRDRAVELAYAELDGPFRTWLAQLGAETDPLQAQAVWHRTARDRLHRLARDLHSRAPATAWSGRVLADRLVTASHAMQRFQRALRKALPHAFATDPARVSS